MASKNISVVDEVYNDLVKHKRAGESFSGELKRLVSGNGKISECAGLWLWMKESDISAIKTSIEKRRRLSFLAKTQKGL